MAKNIFFGLVVIFLISCNAQTNSNLKFDVLTDTSTEYKYNIFYQLAKSKQNQLGLDSIEKGFDKLQIRIWYDFSLIRERDLVIITYKDTTWSASIYNLQVDWDGNVETIISKQIKQVTPKCGWRTFSNKLINLKVLMLPNTDNIKGYGLGLDGRTYNVEVATKNYYRFYGYWEPQDFKKDFWQAKNMAGILDLLEKELGVRQ